MVGVVDMSCPALPTEGKVDDESFSWAVSILAWGYLAVPLLLFLYYFYHHTDFSLSYLQTLTKTFFFQLQIKLGIKHGQRTQGKTFICRRRIFFGRLISIMPVFSRLVPVF